jgi:multisubunit Na+/H+ antiporter MnhE subunit
MGISPGILAVSTQDPTRNPVITALCTHAITITPGEMVIDIIPGKNEEIMCVHCLNAEESARVVQAQQKQRLELVKKVVGDE